MQQHSVFHRAAIVVGVGLASLAVLRCGGGDDDDATAPPPSCQTAGDCRKKTVESPYCSDLDSGACVNSDASASAGKECIYTAKLPACLCLEGDARLCDLDAGVRGVRPCEAKRADGGKLLGLGWGACQPL